MSNVAWQTGAPAIGVAIARLLALHARALRVEAARRLRAANETAKLLEKRHG